MNPYRISALGAFSFKDSHFWDETKSVSYWYKKGAWKHFVGIYEGGVLNKAYLNGVEINPDILLVMDEPSPESDLTVWDAGLNVKQVSQIYNSGIPTDPGTHPISNKLIEWWRLD